MHDIEISKRVVDTTLDEILNESLIRTNSIY